MGFVMIPGEDCCVLLSKPKGDDAVESSVKERLLRCSGVSFSRPVNPFYLAPPLWKKYQEGAILEFPFDVCQKEAH